MGVDVHIMVRHDFHEVDNFEKSVNFVKATIERVKTRLHIDGDLEESFDYYAHEEQNYLHYIRFDIPCIGVTVYLRRGYWSVWTGWHTCQVSNKTHNRLHVADMAFDVTRVLGGEEVWYCDEYLEDECENKTLDELIEIGTKRYGVVEYPYTELMKYDNNQFPPFEPFYHDSFSELRKEYDILCRSHNQFLIPCISNYLPGYIRAIKCDKVNLVKRDSGKVFFPNDVDFIKCIDGYQVVGKKGDMIALFNENAEQLTYFVNGEFEVKSYEHWSPFDKSMRRYIINEEAQIKVMVTYYGDNRIEYKTLPYNSVWVSRKPAKCRNCKGQVVQIVYGEPTQKTAHQAEEGKIILGSCVSSDIAADWECVDCHTKYIKQIIQ